MPDNRLPKKLLFGELQHGKRSLGGPKKRYKDTLKGSLKSFNLNPDTWELAAQNRNEWRAALHNGAKTHEKERTITVEKRRQARKSNADRCSSPAPNVQELSVRRLVWPATYARTNRMIWWSSSTRRTNNKWSTKINDRNFYSAIKLQHLVVLYITIHTRLEVSHNQLWLNVM